MSVTFLDRHRLLRGFICLLICVVMVVMPMTTTHAVVVETAVIVSYILETLIVSLGYNLVTDAPGTVDLVNQMFSDFSDATKTILTNLATAALGNWDHVSLYADIAVDHGAFTAIAFEVTEWLYRHGVIEGQDIPPIITVDKSDTYIMDTSEAITLTPVGNGDSVETIAAFVNQYTRETLVAALGNSVVYQGTFDRVFPAMTVVYGVDRPATAAFLNCADYGGTGRHSLYGNAPGTPAGGLESRRANNDCYFCGRHSVGGEFFALPACTGVSFIGRIGNSYYLCSLAIFDAPKEGEYLPRLGYIPCKYCTYADIYNPLLISSGDLDIPISVPAGSIDVPLEETADYPRGVLTGRWEDLIGKLGNFANSLPFSFPMTSDALKNLDLDNVIPKDLANDPAIDIPDDPAIDLPEVGALTLPKSIINKFPFCIPFDLAKGLELLSAPPVEPRFVIPFKYGDVVNEEIVLDFSDFDYVVRMIRWFEVLLFTMGLAVATRQFIKW